MIDHESLKATLELLKSANVAQAQFTEGETTMVFNFFAHDTFLPSGPKEKESIPAPLAIVTPIRQATDEEILMNPYAGI